MAKVVYIAGHRGMVGSAICRVLEHSDVDLVTATRNELDLCDQSAVHSFFKSRKIDEVYLCAAKVGGIFANNEYPADFIRENLVVQSNVIHSAHASGVEKLLFLGSSCIYPKLASQPMQESALLTGALEPTNEPYAIAKIAGIKMCESYNRQFGRDYRSVMPTNLYGPGDNFHPENSHVIPALIRRFHDAISEGKNEVTIWGSGEAMREFLHVDDMASACKYVMELPASLYSSVTEARLSHINVGTGEDCTIKNLVTTIAAISGFTGSINFDVTKPDGTPRKLLDVSLLNEAGWNHSVTLSDGLKETWEWYLENSNIGVRGRGERSEMPQIYE